MSYFKFTQARMASRSIGWRLSRSLAGVQDELAKLELSRGLELPVDLFGNALPQQLERYRQRVAIKAPYELRPAVN